MGKDKAFAYVVAFGIIVLGIGISLIICGALPFNCGGFTLTKYGQSSCNITPEDGHRTVKVDMDVVTPKKVATYIFTKQPRRAYVDTPFNFSITNKMYGSFEVPSDAATKVSYTLRTTAKVDLQYVGRIGKRTRIIHQKENVNYATGSFVISDTYTSPHFVVSCTDTFSGTLDVIVSSPRWDIKSTAFADKCTMYPCEWNLKDIQFADRKVWVVTDNNGNEEHSMETQLKGSQLGELIAGIILLVLAVIGIVAAVVAMFVFL